MSQLLFIRHAETGMAGTFCGHSDPPLNARGEQQVRELIQLLAPNSLGVVYCSDLRRAKRTAHMIAAAFNLSIVIKPSLREIDFGAWEGLTWAEIEQRDPAYALRWAGSFPHLPAPGGETFAAFQSRVLTAIGEVPPHPGNRQTAIVTHAGVMRVVLRSLEGCDEAEAWNRTKPYCANFTCTPAAVTQECAR